MTSRDEIGRVIQEYVAAEMLDGDSGELSQTTNLLALGILDSMGVVMLRLFVEKTFHVRLPEGPALQFSTIAGLAEIVERIQGEAAA